LVSEKCRVFFARKARTNLQQAVDGARYGPGAIRSVPASFRYVAGTMLSILPRLS
jgi:hypothetical protein